MLTLYRIDPEKEGLRGFFRSPWLRFEGSTQFVKGQFVSFSKASQQKKRLQEKLEHLENAPVALRYKNDPALIGGLSLRKGNIVYDVSLRGNLERLLEQITEG